MMVIIINGSSSTGRDRDRQGQTETDGQRKREKFDKTTDPSGRSRRKLFDVDASVRPHP